MSDDDEQLELGTPPSEKAKAPHRMRSLVSVEGVARDGVITCECGWVHAYARLVQGLRAHARHVQSHQVVN